MYLYTCEFSVGQPTSFRQSKTLFFNLDLVTQKWKNESLNFELVIRIEIQYLTK